VNGATSAELRHPQFASVVTNCFLIVERASAANQFARIGGILPPRLSVIVPGGGRMPPIRW